MWRPAAEQSAAESAAAESMERRAGTKGNASQQSTCRAQSRISVSQAPDRMRQLLAVWTRGGSRMRESRTYGSVRGACDETHVPTATPPRVHHAARRRGGCVAALHRRSELDRAPPGGFPLRRLVGSCITLCDRFFTAHAGT